MDIKSITRTAAVIYAEQSSSRKTQTIKKKFIEAALVNCDNKPLTVSEIADEIFNTLGLIFHEDEIASILDNNESLQEITGDSKSQNRYYLENKRFLCLREKGSNTLLNSVKLYIEQSGSEYSEEEVERVIERYLYSLLNSNIQAYSTVLNPRQATTLNIDEKEFTSSEIDIINDFVKWDNKEKNDAIFNLISYCIEYAIVSNNSSEDIILRAIKNKVFYLDNSLLYRALGINGETRKRRALVFLKKCNESGQKLYITKFTRDEFFSSVDFHVKLLSNSTPFGRINPGLFTKYANGEGFYQYYHQWRKDRKVYGFDIFKSTIQNAYETLIKEYKIQEDYKIPFDGNSCVEQLNKYTSEIKAIKNTGDGSATIDAQNILWIEYKRGAECAKLVDTKYYFITTDQKLQTWDSYHSKNQPIALLPSQWLGLLLKFGKRSDDDFKSFISFLCIPHDTNKVSEEELQESLAGISEITEDFQAQAHIYELLIANQFENKIKKDYTHYEAKEFAKSTIENEYIAKIQEERQKHNQTKELTIAERQKYQNEADARLQKAKEKANNDKLYFLESFCKHLNKTKTKIDMRLKRFTRVVKWSLFVIFILVVTFWVLLIIKYGWDVMEMWTYFVGGLQILYIVITSIFDLKISINSLVSKMISWKYNRLACEYEYNPNDHKLYLEELSNIKQLSK